MPTPIEVVQIRALPGTSAVKAFVDVRLGGITIKGAKIIQQPDGKTWLAMPAVKAGRGWQNVVDLTTTLRQRMTEIVLEAWQARENS